MDSAARLRERWEVDALLALVSHAGAGKLSRGEILSMKVSYRMGSSSLVLLVSALSLTFGSCATNHGTHYADGHRTDDHGRSPAAATVKVKTQLERITARYAFMEELKREFDQHLLQKTYGAGGPLDQPSYYQMRAAWADQHEEVDAVIVGYAATMEAALNRQVPLQEVSDLQDTIVNAVAGRSTPLQGAPALFTRHALMDLGDHFSQVSARYATRIASVPSDDPSMAGVSSLGSSFSELSADKQALENFSDQDFEAAIKAAKASKHADIANQLQEKMAQTKHQLNQRGVGRKPAADSVYYPTASSYSTGSGTGGPGNLFGYNFKSDTWAFTFDDGPHPTLTAQVRANLEHFGYNATFFMLAGSVIGLPGVLAAQRADGFDLACHSWSHANLINASDATLDKEITQAVRKEEQLMSPGTSGPSDPNYRHIKLFRLPYGSGAFPADVRNHPRAMQKIADNGLIEVTWNVDTLDWQDHDPNSVYRRTMQQIHELGKGIILFHDVHPQSVIASKMVMQWMGAPTDTHGSRTDANGNAYPAKRVCTIQGIVDEANHKIQDCRKWVTALH